MHGSVSSFAFQGTNAHAVLGLASLAVVRTPQAEAWQRSRLWYQAPSHPQLQHFRGLSRASTSAEPYALVQCSLHQPAMSYLLDHSLQGVPVLPSSVLLEMAWAAGRMLCLDTPNSNTVAVCGASFHHQVALDSSTLAVTTCGVAVGGGAVWLAGQPRLEGDPALKLVSASLQSVAGPDTGAALPVDSQHLPSKESDAASIDAAAVPAAVTVLYLASLLARGTTQASHTNTSSMHADMPSDYGVPPAAAIACQQLASVNDMPAMFSGTVLPAAVGVYVPLPCPAWGQAPAASATGDSRRSAQQLHGGSRQMLSVLDSQLKAMTHPSVELGIELNAAAGLRDATPGQMQLHSSLSQPTQQHILTVILETASMLLGNSVDADQPLMEAGLDSIGEVDPGI